MEFYIGQTFEGMYSPEAAAWCNTHNAHIETVNGVRTIVENPLPPPPTPEQIVQMYEDAVQGHLDATAQSRDYDNTYTCLSYLSSTDEIWYRESHAFNAWRDQVWRNCHEILNAVVAGTIAPPTVEELLAQLPVIDWNDPDNNNATKGE